MNRASKEQLTSQTRIESIGYRIQLTANAVRYDKEDRSNYRATKKNSHQTNLFAKIENKKTHAEKGTCYRSQAKRCVEIHRRFVQARTQS